MKLPRTCFASLLVLLAAAPAVASRPPQPPNIPSPASAKSLDASQLIDINNIAMYVTNTGSFACDRTIYGPGLEYPKGTGKTCVFAAGLWLGGRVAGQVRVAVSEYSDEYGPGAMIGTAPDDPGKPEYHVYKLYRAWADPAARDAALADYDAGAVPHGAPAVTLQPDGTLDIPGDEMLWAVYNDASPSNHTNQAGGTNPLGIEVQQTTYAFNRPGALGNTVFIRFRIVNKGGNTIDSMYVSLWSDPDVGGASDDLVGCDPALDVGYGYNATNSDFVYGAQVPAVGYVFLEGPRANGVPLPMTSFDKYINGTDPNSSTKTYNLMKGLQPDGAPLVNPTNGQVTTFMVSGDPVLGTGWLDTNPADRRLQISSGPFTMSPGDEQVVTTAIVIGRGSDRLASVNLMRGSVVELHDSATPTQLALVGTTASPGRVRMEWYSDEGGLQVAVERRTETTGWSRVGDAASDGTGHIVYEDRDVAPGGRYGYRLMISRGGATEYAGEAWVSVPFGPALSVGGLRVAGSRVLLGLTLGSGGPARIEMMDVSGRRVLDRGLEALGPGEHEIDLCGTELRAGLYFVRLMQGAQRVAAKRVLAR